MKRCASATEAINFPPSAPPPPTPSRAATPWRFLQGPSSQCPSLWLQPGETALSITWQPHAPAASTLTPPKPGPAARLLPQFCLSKQRITVLQAALVSSPLAAVLTNQRLLLLTPALAIVGEFALHLRQPPAYRGSSALVAQPTDPFAVPSSTPPFSSVEPEEARYMESQGHIATAKWFGPMCLVSTACGRLYAAYPGGRSLQLLRSQGKDSPAWRDIVAVLPDRVIASALNASIGRVQVKTGGIQLTEPLLHSLLALHQVQAAALQKLSHNKAALTQHSSLLEEALSALDGGPTAAVEARLARLHQGLAREQAVCIAASLQRYGHMYSPLAGSFSHGRLSGPVQAPATTAALLQTLMSHQLPEAALYLLLGPLFPHAPGSTRPVFGHWAPGKTDTVVGEKPITGETAIVEALAGAVGLNPSGRLRHAGFAGPRLLSFLAAAVDVRLGPLAALTLSSPALLQYLLALDGEGPMEPPPSYGPLPHPQSAIAAALSLVAQAAVSSGALETAHASEELAGNLEASVRLLFLSNATRDLGRLSSQATPLSPFLGTLARLASNAKPQRTLNGQAVNTADLVDVVHTAMPSAPLSPPSATSTQPLTGTNPIIGATRPRTGGLLRHIGQELQRLWAGGASALSSSNAAEGGDGLATFHHLADAAKASYSSPLRAEVAAVLTLLFEEATQGGDDGSGSSGYDRDSCLRMPASVLTLPGTAEWRSSDDSGVSRDSASLILQLPPAHPLPYPHPPLALTNAMAWYGSVGVIPATEPAAEGADTSQASNAAQFTFTSASQGKAVAEVDLYRQGRWNGAAAWATPVSFAQGVQRWWKLVTEGIDLTKKQGKGKRGRGPGSTLDFQIQPRGLKTLGTGEDRVIAYWRFEEKDPATAGSGNRDSDSDAEDVDPDAAWSVADTKDLGKYEFHGQLWGPTTQLLTKHPDLADADLTPALAPCTASFDFGDPEQVETPHALVFGRALPNVKASAAPVATAVEGFQSTAAPRAGQAGTLAELVPWGVHVRLPAWSYLDVGVRPRETVTAGITFEMWVCLGTEKEAHSMASMGEGDEDGGAGHALPGRHVLCSRLERVMDGSDSSHDPHTRRALKRPGGDPASAPSNIPSVSLSEVPGALEEFGRPDGGIGDIIAEAAADRKEKADDQSSSSEEEEEEEQQEARPEQSLSSQQQGQLRRFLYHVQRKYRIQWLLSIDNDRLQFESSVAEGKSAQGGGDGEPNANTSPNGTVSSRELNLQFGEWHHIAFSLDAGAAVRRSGGTASAGGYGEGSVKLYFDGECVGEGAVQLGSPQSYYMSGERVEVTQPQMDPMVFTTLPRGGTPLAGPFILGPGLSGKLAEVRAWASIRDADDIASFMDTHLDMAEKRRRGRGLAINISAAKDPSKTPSSRGLGLRKLGGIAKKDGTAGSPASGGLGSSLAARLAARKDSTASGAGPSGLNPLQARLRQRGSISSSVAAGGGESKEGEMTAKGRLSFSPPKAKLHPLHEASDADAEEETPDTREATPAAEEGGGSPEDTGKSPAAAAPASWDAFDPFQGSAGPTAPSVTQPIAAAPAAAAGFDDPFGADASPFGAETTENAAEKESAPVASSGEAAVDFADPFAADPFAGGEAVQALPPAAQQAPSKAVAFDDPFGDGAEAFGEEGKKPEDASEGTVGANEEGKEEEKGEGEDEAMKNEEGEEQDRNAKEEEESDAEEERAEEEKESDVKEEGAEEKENKETEEEQQREEEGGGEEEESGLMEQQKEGNQDEGAEGQKTADGVVSDEKAMPEPYIEKALSVSEAAPSSEEEGEKGVSAEEEGHSFGKAFASTSEDEANTAPEVAAASEEVDGQTGEGMEAEAMDVKEKEEGKEEEKKEEEGATNSDVASQRQQAPPGSAGDFPMEDEAIEAETEESSASPAKAHRSPLNTSVASHDLGTALGSDNAVPGPEAEEEGEAGSHEYDQTRSSDYEEAHEEATAMPQGDAVSEPSPGVDELRGGEEKEEEEEEKKEEEGGGNSTAAEEKAVLSEDTAEAVAADSLTAIDADAGAGSVGTSKEAAKETGPTVPDEVQGSLFASANEAEEEDSGKEDRAAPSTTGVPPKEGDEEEKEEDGGNEADGAADAGAMLQSEEVEKEGPEGIQEEPGEPLKEMQSPDERENGGRTHSSTTAPESTTHADSAVNGEPSMAGGESSGGEDKALEDTTKSQQQPPELGNGNGNGNERSSTEEALQQSAATEEEKDSQEDN